MSRKDYFWKLSIGIGKNGKCLKSIVNDLKIVCYEIIYVMDIASTNVTSTIVKNAASTVSINHSNKNVEYKMEYTLLALSLVIILLFIIIFISHYCAIRSKLKHVGTLAV